MLQRCQCFVGFFTKLGKPVLIKADEQGVLAIFDQGHNELCELVRTLFIASVIFRLTHPDPCLGVDEETNLGLVLASTQPLVDAADVGRLGVIHRDDITFIISDRHRCGIAGGIKGKCCLDLEALTFAFLIV